MAPTEQEKRCAALLCEHLSENAGSDWRVDEWLDDLNDSEPTPDVVLTDGVDDIAFEIKQLTDGAAFGCHDQDIQSLYYKLAPKIGGEYFLVPPSGIWRRFDRKLIRQLKSRIDNAAVNLKVGEPDGIEISRQATIRFCGEHALGKVNCSHTDGEVFPVRLQGVDGLYYLQDDCGPRHKFITEDCRTAFIRKLEEICAELRQKGQDAHSEIQWTEEWELHKVRNLPNDTGGVLVVGIAADFLESAAIESIKKEIEKGKHKFEKRRWARYSAIALHAGVQQREVSPCYFYDALTKLERTEVHPLDLVFLVSEDSEEPVRQFDFTH